MSGNCFLHVHTGAVLGLEPNLMETGVVRTVSAAQKALRLIQNNSRTSTYYGTGLTSGRRSGADRITSLLHAAPRTLSSLP